MKLETTSSSNRYLKGKSDEISSLYQWGISSNQESEPELRKYKDNTLNFAYDYSARASLEHYGAIEAYQQIVRNLWDDRQYFKTYIDLLLENITKEEFESLISHFERDLVTESSENDQLVFSCILSTIPESKINPDDVADITGWSLGRIHELQEARLLSLKEGGGQLFVDLVRSRYLPAYGD
jgi:hypothetical protein